jgi:hypothetical protein
VKCADVFLEYPEVDGKGQHEYSDNTAEWNVAYFEHGSAPYEFIHECEIEKQSRGHSCIHIGVYTAHSSYLTVLCVFRYRQKNILLQS